MDTKKPKVLMLKGLPASGKSTYAKELVDKEGYVRVNKDDLRAMMDLGKWSKSNEKRILTVRDSIIRYALTEGKSVVVDDTNFHESHKTTLQEMAENFQVNFEVLFIDTPLEDCIKRNEARANKVPVSVIVDMYNKYIAPLRDEVIEYDDKLKETIIVDVDGTLAHITDRNPYDASRAMDDLLDDAVSNIVAMAYGHGYHITILTGRHSGHLQVTKDWLKKHGVEYDSIYCRTEGDNRPDTEIKKELFDAHIRGKFNVKYVIDDRPSVCRMWRSLGLKTLQVGDPHKEF